MVNRDRVGEIVPPAHETSGLEDAPVSEAPNRVVYTALLGGYETLQEQPVALESSVPFICFTDDPSLTSETWDVRLIEPVFALDSIRSARALKIMGHESLSEFNQTVWVDNRVTLKVAPEQLFEQALQDADFVALEHSFRDALIDEFDAVVDGGYDDPARVYEQLIHYAEAAPDVLDMKPIWTGLLVRRMNQSTFNVMRTWLDHVLRYSRRDQLSVLFALSTTESRFKILELDNRESDWHSWPPLSPDLGRKKSLRSHRFEHSIRAPLARFRRGTVRGDELLVAYQESAQIRDEELKKLRKQLEQRTNELSRSVKELAGVKASGSYRLARRISRVRSALIRPKK